jgi:hypothetical protein
LADYEPLEIFILIIPDLTLPEHLPFIVAEPDLDDLRKGRPADWRGRPGNIEL